LGAEHLDLLLVCALGPVGKLIDAGPRGILLRGRRGRTLHSILEKYYRKKEKKTANCIYPPFATIKKDNLPHSLIISTKD
jgi:hypothetical protein